MIFTIFHSCAGFNSIFRFRSLSLSTLGRQHESQTRVLLSVKAMTAWLLLCSNALLRTQGSSGLVPIVSSYIYMKYSCLLKVLRPIHNVPQGFCIYS